MTEEYNNIEICKREKQLTKTTAIGLVVNMFLTIGKFYAGFFGNSAAMIADAVHSLSDLVSDVVIIFCVRIASKGQDEGHKYGHGKFETLATLIVSLLLAFVSIKLIISGINDIISFINGEQLQIPENIALWAALISIIAKEILYHYTIHVGKKTKSDVVIANAWHHRTDALSSICSGIGIGGTMILGAKWGILDPIACCGISIFIMIIALKMAIPAIMELLEESLPKKTEEEIMQIARQVDGLKDIHGLKTRKSGPYIIIEAHIVVNPQMTVETAHNITTSIERLWRQKYGMNTMISLHVEPSCDAE